MKTFISLNAALAMMLSASIAHGETLTEAMQACSVEKNDLKRLMCFDNVAESLNSSIKASTNVDESKYRNSEKPVITAKPTSENSSPMEVQTRRVQDFGMEEQRQAESRPQTVSASVTSIKKAPSESDNRPPFSISRHIMPLSKVIILSPRG